MFGEQVTLGHAYIIGPKSYALIRAMFACLIGCTIISIENGPEDFLQMVEINNIKISSIQVLSPGKNNVKKEN